MTCDRKCYRAVFSLSVCHFHQRVCHLKGMAFPLNVQAETEELAKKVDSLIAENVALKSEISRLTGNSDKLRLENATLTVPLASLASAFNTSHTYNLLF